MTKEDKIICLDSFLANFANEFPGMSFRYEFSNHYNCFIISYTRPFIVDDSFWEGLIKLEDEIIDELGEYFALFSEEGEYYKVSDNATIIESKDAVNLICSDNCISVEDNDYSFLNFGEEPFSPDVPSYPYAA